MTKPKDVIGNSDSSHCSVAEPLTFGSLFAGIGGIDLAASVSALCVEPNFAFSHQLNSYFLKLAMPDCMWAAFANNKILWAIIVLVKVNVMNHLAWLKRPSSSSCCNLNVFSYVSALICVWMLWHQQVEIAVAKFRALSSLLFCLSTQYATTFPKAVFGTLLISLCGNSRLDAHLAHSVPNYLLSCAVFGSYLGLRHSQVAVIVLKLFFSKRNRISVLVAHAGIVLYASRF